MEGFNDRSIGWWAPASLKGVLANQRGAKATALRGPSPLKGLAKGANEVDSVNFRFFTLKIKRKLSLRPFT